MRKIRRDCAAERSIAMMGEKTQKNKFAEKSFTTHPDEASGSTSL